MAELAENKRIRQESDRRRALLCLKELQARYRGQLEPLLEASAREFFAFDSVAQDRPGPMWERLMLHQKILRNWGESVMRALEDLTEA